MSSRCVHECARKRWLGTMCIANEAIVMVLAKKTRIVLPIRTSS